MCFVAASLLTAHEIFRKPVLDRDRRLTAQNVFALDKARRCEAGVIADEKHLAELIAADDDANIPAKPFEEIPYGLARADLRILERRLVDVADELRRDAERRKDASDDLLVSHPVEIAILVDMTAARRVPRNAVALQHDAVSLGGIRGLSRQDDTGNGKKAAEIDRAFVARLELKLRPRHRDRRILGAGESEDRPRLAPSVLDIDRFPVEEIRVVDAHHRGLARSQLLIVRIADECHSGR